MNHLKSYILNVFIRRNFYIGAGICIAALLSTFFFSWNENIAVSLLFIFCFLLLIDYTILFVTNLQPKVRRTVPLRMSNGEMNTVSWTLRNDFFFRIIVILVDEWPSQFQFRNQSELIKLKPHQQKKVSLAIFPVERGKYEFGDIHLYVSSPIGFLSRKFTTSANCTVSCYPAFLQMSKYGLHSNQALWTQQGTLQMRRIGQSMEFEQIKEYVSGEDLRTVNWKATARSRKLMVNQYIEERAQQVYCVVDKGRLMKMPFEGMTLLDYAINSTLAISSVSLKKKDKTGLITFSDHLDTMLPADNRSSQMKKIMEALYNESTSFPECDFEKLYTTVRSNIRNRSLLVLFTNFETVSGMQRHLSALRLLAKYHLLLVVFFKNTELKGVIKKQAKDLEQVYIKTIAEKYYLEKKAIAHELERYGILSILAAPSDLTFKTLNKYLELKTKQAL